MMDVRPMNLGAYLRSIRNDGGLSLRDVEKLAKEKRIGPELSAGYLSLLETKKDMKPSPRILYALASIYGVDYIDLMKRVGYIPKEVDIQGYTPAKVAFRGADHLDDEQKGRIQHIIDLELRDSLRNKRKKKD